MPFPEFLAQRRRLMAMVVRDAFALLADPHYQPAHDTPTMIEENPSQTVDLFALVEADQLPPGTILRAGDGPYERLAQVLADGRLYADGDSYDGLLDVSEALGIDTNPWTTWSADLPDGRVLLAVLRDAAEPD